MHQHHSTFGGLIGIVGCIFLLPGLLGLLCLLPFVAVAILCAPILCFVAWFPGLIECVLGSPNTHPKRRIPDKNETARRAVRVAAWTKETV